ncbi:hypothetical protein Tco_1034878 [Tanacetum coccineum]
MSALKNKVCKLIKSLYGLKHAPKQWHQKFDEVVLSSGYLLNQASKFYVDLTKEFLSSRFSMKDMKEADVIIVSTPIDTSEKLMPSNGQVVSQLEYSRVTGCRMYVMTCTRPDIAFAVSKLSRYTSNPSTQHWQAIQRALKVRHSMIRELIINGVVSIEFVRSQQNLADHLTKGLARDLVLKSAEGMGLKSNQWTEEPMYLTNHSMDVLEPAEKEDEIFTSQWELWTFSSYNIYELDMDTWLV